MAPGAAPHVPEPKGKKPVLAVLGVALALLAGSLILFPYLVDQPESLPRGPRGSPPTDENAPPVAVFTASCDELACAFDGADSRDPDGDLEAYAWDFGDGTTGEGATADHTYEKAGTYTVTLTVTDDDGDRDDAAKEVTAEAPPPPPPPEPNKPPTASFSHSCGANRTCHFDGSGSSDPDGNVTSYSWTFGDGNASTGAVVTHRYGASGVYQVTLMVTDDDGATDSRTWQVLVQ